MCTPKKKPQQPAPPHNQSPGECNTSDSVFFDEKNLNLCTPNWINASIGFRCSNFHPNAWTQWRISDFLVPLQYELSSLSQDPLDSGKFWHFEGRNPGTQNNFVVSSILLGFFFVANVDTQCLINHLCKKVYRYIYCIHVCMSTRVS